MKKITLLPLAAALMLAGCGDNAQLDLDDQVSQNISNDYSVFSGYSISKAQAENTILNPEFAKNQVALFEQFYALIDNVPRELNDDAAWLKKAQSLKSNIQKANLGEYGDELSGILSSAMEKVKARQPLVEQATTDDAMMVYLAKRSNRAYQRYRKAEKKLTDFGDFGKTEFTAMQAAKKAYDIAYEQADVSPKYRALLDKFVTDNAIAISKRDVAARFRISYQYKSEGNDCKAPQQFISPIDHVCYEYSYQSFRYSNNYDKLSDTQKTQLDTIAANIAKEAIPLWNTRLETELAYKAAQAANKDVSIISENKFGSSYSDAYNDYRSASLNLSRASYQLFNAESHKIDPQSKGYRYYTLTILDQADLESRDISAAALKTFRHMDNNQLHQTWLDAVKAQATAIDISDDGSFSVEGDVYVLLTINDKALDTTMSYIGYGNADDDIVFNKKNGRIFYNNLTEALIEYNDMFNSNSMSYLLY